MNRYTSNRFWLLICATAMLVGLGACQPADPVEKLQATRAMYEAEASSFYVQEVPQDTEVAPEEGDESNEEESDGEDMAEAELPTQSILSLDILVSTSSTEPLAGITVELEQVDSAGAVKSSRQLWLDTTGVQKGVSATKTVRIEDIDYAEGDGFFVSILSPVPADAMANYREFDGVASL
jgi:hypothetical protein